MSQQFSVGEEGYEEMINSPAYLRQAHRKGFITEKEKERLENRYQAKIAYQAQIDALENAQRPSVD